MKIHLLSYLALIVFYPLLAAAEAADFHWGSGAAEVKAREHGAPRREASSGAVSYLVYSGNLSGEEASVIYRLIHGKLFETSYVIESRGRGCAELKRIFERLASELSTRHGLPQPGDTADDCNIQREWDLGDTILALNLSTKSGRSDLSAVYQSKSLAKIAEEVAVRAGT